MLVIASENGHVGISAAIEVLRGGGSALDAVEAATKLVEANVDDHSVGVGGYPNLLGEVELDASIMEGATRRAGAVAALQGFPHPISIARAIMERLPQHVLLTGAGAARFAREMGFSEAPLLTKEVENIWRQYLADSAVNPISGRALSEEERDLLSIAQTTAPSDKSAGTVNFIARDSHGRMASAVSTSGWAFKYPGRVGDSPIIGAGNYCDDRFGACTCTGLGEWSIRAGTARAVVLGLQKGPSIEQACRAAMEDLKSIPLPKDLTPMMNLIALDSSGRHTGFSTYPDNTYIWQEAGMESYATAPRQVV